MKQAKQDQKESNLLAYFYLIDKIRLDSNLAASIYLDKFTSYHDKKAIIKILRSNGGLN